MLTNPFTGLTINANPEGHNQYWNPVDANSGVSGRKGFASKDSKYYIGRHRPGYGNKRRRHYLRSNRSGTIYAESSDENKLMKFALDREIEQGLKRRKFR